MNSIKIRVSYAELFKTRRYYNVVAFKFVLKYFNGQIQARGEGVGWGVKLSGIYLPLVYAVADDDFLVRTQQT